jgi:hypothetical protein
MTAMTVTIDEIALAREMRTVQARWRKIGNEEGWFAELHLEAVATSPSGTVAFTFRDRYGQLFGWRWHSAGEPLSERDWPTVMTADLAGNLSGFGCTPPDADGVRWLVPEGDIPAAGTGAR